MASNIPPKRRETAKQTFYTKGETDKEVKAFGVKSHIAEPSTALTVVQRNPSHYEEINIKPKAPYIRTRGYTPGLYSGMCESVQKEHQLVNGIASLSEAKLLKKKEYSEMAVKPTMLCAKTVTPKEFSKQNDGQNKDQIPVSENWLYRTRMQPVAKDPNKDVFGYSEDAPQWFKVTETTNVKDHNIEKSQGYDGTLTILSRISGWITVSPHSRNRQKRLGRYGPFDKSKKGNNYQNVSDLAPAWMQTEFSRNDETEYKNQLAPVNVRQEKKRVFLVDKDQPIKSAWSAGDFRHNVMTADEAKKFSFGLGEVQNRIFEWKEEVNKQKYDKPVAGKIGSRY